MRLIAIVLIVTFLGSSTGLISLPSLPALARQAHAYPAFGHPALGHPALGHPGLSLTLPDHARGDFSPGSTFDFLIKCIAALPLSLSDLFQASDSKAPGELDSETAAAWLRLRTNPPAVLASISAGQGGREKLALVRALLSGGGRAEAEKAISPFLTVNALRDFTVRLDQAGIPDILGIPGCPGIPGSPCIRVSDIERTGIPFDYDSVADDAYGVAPADDNAAASHPPAATHRKDTALHIMGGAAIALLAAAAAYEFLPAWSPPERALVLAAIAICAAAFFGALKEALDALGLGAVEMRDFLNTVAGGTLAGVAIGAFSCLVAATGLSVAAGVVTFAVGSLILGIPVGRVFIESSLGKLRASRVES